MTSSLVLQFMLSYRCDNQDSTQDVLFRKLNGCSHLCLTSWLYHLPSSLMYFPIKRDGRLFIVECKRSLKAVVFWLMWFKKSWRLRADQWECETSYMQLLMLQETYHNWLFLNLTFLSFILFYFLVFETAGFCWPHMWKISNIQQAASSFQSQNYCGSALHRMTNRGWL